MHGGLVDGSGWEGVGVSGVLKKDGYEVSVVQNPTTSLARRSRRSPRPSEVYVSNPEAVADSDPGKLRRELSRVPR